MTDTPSNPARRRRRRPSALPVVAGSLSAFFATFGFMAYQLRTGHDPALGSKSATTVALAPRQVVEKRIERHVIITKLLPPREEGDDGGGVQVAAVAVPAAAPVQSAPVVVQSAPAPAPAPAAAPVVTRTS